MVDSDTVLWDGHALHNKNNKNVPRISAAAKILLLCLRERVMSWSVVLLVARGGNVGFVLGSDVVQLHELVCRM